MSGQVDLNRISELSEALGVSGSELISFIKEQNDLARSERAAERAENQAAREFALAQGTVSQTLPEPERTTIKLLPLKDRDDITAYLTRFERVAAVYNWNDGRMAIQLANLLQDRALTIYSTFDDLTTSSYNSLKAALLKAFKLNEEHYRKEFRAARLGASSTFEQFATDLKRKFDLWMRSADVNNDYESIRDKMLCDQFLASVTPELRCFIREQSASSLHDMVKISDNYGSAHAAIFKQISDSM